MLLAKDWKEFEVLDAFDGQKIERWGDFVLQRPDGQVVWSSYAKDSLDKSTSPLRKGERGGSGNLKEITPNPSLSRGGLSVDAIYLRSDTGGGNWKFNKDIPKRWIMNYKNLKFYVEPTGFKHTGLFPEQAVNWDFVMDCLNNSSAFGTSSSKRRNSENSPSSKREYPQGEGVKILNLFAYTGAASVACATAGADVVHVDASKGMNIWARENAELNNVGNKIRFITEDVKKFVQREIRRGNKYDGVIMDPPVYGRGPNGELWEIEKEIQPLVHECAKLLSTNAKFLIINAYTSNISLTGFENLLKSEIKLKGKIEVQEIGLPIKNSNLALPCGLTARWSN